MIRTFYSIAFISVIIACQSASSQTFQKVTADELKSLKAEGVLVVDIRTPREYKNGHIAGVDQNVDFLGNDFLGKMLELGASEPVIIYCAVGGRSGRASALLKEAGFEKVYDYSGGFKDWASRGELIEK